MKHLIHLLSCLFLAILCLGCSDEEYFDGTPSQPSEGILLRLTNGSLANTKAPALGSTANLHHVTDVYALLYQMSADGSDGTFKLCKQLDWNPTDSSEYAIDQVQFYQFWLSEENDAKDLAAGTYRILCIGLDNQVPDPDKRIDGEVWPDAADYHTSGTTYNLPDAIKNQPLSKALATLAEGKTQEDIAHSELFAGWADFDYFPGTLSEVTVEMKRRVAGVLCYLTDIPYSLTLQDKGSYRVTGVRLCLSQPQNTTIPLCRTKATVDGSLPDDFGSAPFGTETEEGKILAGRSFYESYTYTDATGTIREALRLVNGYGKQADNLYKIDNTGKPIKPNSVLFGAYLLPIKHDASTGGTLTVHLLGRRMDSDLESERTHPDPEATEEEVIRSFPALDMEHPESGENYNIYPNFIYQIGRKPTPGLSPDEYPESLIGNRLNLCVKQWQSEEIPVEYPEVPIYATMSFDKEELILDCMGTPWYETYRGGYPLDKKEEIEYHKLHITPSLLGKPWKVVIQDEGLYIKTSDKGNAMDETFAKEYSPENYTQPFDLDILLTDYIQKRDYQHDPTYKGLNIKDDYRTIKVYLYTYDDKEMNNPIHTDTISVKQNNAITVNVLKENGKDYYGRVCAFARYDLGSTLYPSGGYESAYRKHWAYRGVIGTEILGVVDDRHTYEGDLNYRHAISEANDKWTSHPDQYLVSAIRYSARKRIEVQDNGAGEFKLKTLEDKNKYWYLPASYELISFLRLPGKLNIPNPQEVLKERMYLHIYDQYGTEEEKTSIYWTSTANYGGLPSDYNTAWASYVTGSGHVPGEIARDKNEMLFIRQACVMPDTQ